MLMSPFEHYAKAEGLLEAAQRAYIDNVPEDRVDRLIRRAQVHATLATAKTHLPVIVTAPAELIDQVKTVDAGAGGVLFIPNEIATGQDPREVRDFAEQLTEQLVEQMRHPITEVGS
jgi:hypothetical protein